MRHKLLGAILIVTCWAGVHAAQGAMSTLGLTPKDLETWVNDSIYTSGFGLPPLTAGVKKAAIAPGPVQRAPWCGRSEPLSRRS